MDSSRTQGLFFSWSIIDKLMQRVCPINDLYILAQKDMCGAKMQHKSFISDLIWNIFRIWFNIEITVKPSGIVEKMCKKYLNSGEKNEAFLESKSGIWW